MNDQKGSLALEEKKRRKEWSLIVGLTLLLLLLSWIEFRLFGLSRSLPFVHSIFFFGLVNFNIILFLFLIFFIFRNVLKGLSEKQGGLIGSTLKNKLIAAFVGFSIVPTALMFIVSVFYINSTFDKWFSEKMEGVLKSSMEVSRSYFLRSKRNNYHFAGLISESISPLVRKPKTTNVLRTSQSKIDADAQFDRKLIEKRLGELVKRYHLDAVEYYPGLFSPRVLIMAASESSNGIPEISLEFKKKGILGKNNASFIHHYGDGDLVRVIVPLPNGGGAIVVSTLIPLGLIAKMNDVTSTFVELRDSSTYAYPIKSIYLIILVLMTLVILLGGTWAGFYMAKQLSIPLESLVQATKRLGRGEYQLVDQGSSSPEIGILVDQFNIMTKYLEASEKEVKDVESSLRKTLARLDAHSRYIEVVLSNVTTGVISIDSSGVVTMVNRYACHLFGIEAKDFVGKRANSVLNKDSLRVFYALLKSLRVGTSKVIQREETVEIQKRSVLIRMTLSTLQDQVGTEIGKVLVFDDLTMVQKAQRAAAWTEVARRIAHEIKNPLTPISLSAQRLQRKFSASITDPAFNDCTNMIIDQVNDLKALVNEFSKFARLPQSNPSLGSLNQVVDDSLKLFSQAHAGEFIKTILDNSMPEFLFDPDQIKRVVTNLVDNSFSALLKNGEITVTTKFDQKLKIARVIVEDDGTGVSEKIRDRIFEPYVTTKKSGTGLGLAIVRKTIEDHNGFIRAYSRDPKGTRIIFELPVVASPLIRLKT